MDQGPYGSNEFWRGVESIDKEPGNYELYAGLGRFTATAMQMKFRKEVSLFCLFCLFCYIYTHP